MAGSRMVTGDRQLLEQWVTYRDADALRRVLDRYAGMMYATCRRVLGNTPDAEDATQDCLEFLVQTRDVPDTLFLGPWLHGIAANKARMRLRSDSRRHNREMKSAESEPHAAEPAWNDVAQYVDEAIAELPDGIRVPLLAHYFQGESHSAIAQATGVPRRTVSNRITRGIHLVGATLKRQGVSASATVLGALFSTHLAEASPLSAKLAAFTNETLVVGQPAVQAAATAGVRGMIVRFSLGIAIIGGASGLWWTAQEGDNRTAGNTPRASVEEESAQAQFADVGSSDATLESAPAAQNDRGSDGAARGDGFVIVQAVDQRATPQAGAEITLQLWNNPRDSGPFASLITLSGVTNEEGEVTFDRIAEKEFAATVTADGSVGYGWVRAGIYSRERLVLRSAEQTKVHVIDENSTPVSNARAFILSASPKSQRKFSPGNRVFVGATGNDGSLDLAIPREQTWEIQIIAEHHASVIVDGVASGGDYEIELRDGATLSGVLRPDNLDVNVSGVVVAAQSTEYELDSRTTETDQSGRFVIENLNSGEYAIAIKSDAVALLEGEVTLNPSPGDPDELELNAVESAVISGIVRTDKNKLSIAEANIAVSRTVDGRRVSRSARSDRNGRYRIPGLSPGVYRVKLYETGPRTVSGLPPQEEIAISAGEIRDDVHFVVTENPAVSASVEGRVTFKGAPVSAFVSAFARSGSSRIATMRTDGRGRFRFDELPATRDLRLRAYRPGQASEESNSLVLAPEGLSGITLALQPAGSVSGRIVGTSGRALDSDTHFVNFMNGFTHRINSRSTSTVLEGGRFYISDVPAGQHNLSVDEIDPDFIGTGIRTPDGTLAIAPGEHVEDFVLTIEDRRGGTSKSRADRRADQERMIRESREREKRAWGVRGRVVDARTGDAVTAYFLEAVRMGENKQDVSDDQGRFEVQPKDVERAIIRIEAPGYQPSKTFLWPVDVVDRFVEAEIRLEPGPVIEGVVQNSQGQPVVGARVFPEKLPGDFESQHARFPTTDRTGQFRLDSLEPTPQEIFVERIGFPITKVDVSPQQSRITNIVVTLPAGARIEGTVTENGAPVAGTRISHYARWHQQRQPSMQTGDDGRFLVEHVAQGTVRVNAWLSNDGSQSRSYRYQSREILVDGDGTYHADFDFKTPTNIIQGAITLNGEAAPSASVSAYMQIGNTKESSDSSSTQTGTYQLEPLPPGKAIITASVRTPGAQTSIRQRTEIRLGNNESLTMDFDFQGTGIVQGDIENISPGEHGSVFAIAGNTPPRGPFETVYDLQVTEYVARAQIKDGGYVLEGLPPGQYVIHAVSRDQHLFEPNRPRMASALVTVKPDEPIQLDFSF